MEKQKEIKLNFKGTVKRVNFPATYKDFLNLVNNAFPQSKNKTLSVIYIDEEGDLITISNDFDYENCKQFAKVNGIDVVKVNLDWDQSEVINEEHIDTTQSKKVEDQPIIEKVEEKKEVKNDIPNIENENQTSHEENIKKILSSTYENIKDFVDKNGGVENVFNLFKDDLHSLKSQFFNNLREMKEKMGFPCFPRGPHCWKFREGRCGKKFEGRKDHTSEVEGVEEFKKKIEKKLDKSFKKMKEKLVSKMARKYSKMVEKSKKAEEKKQPQENPSGQQNPPVNTVTNQEVHQRVTCDGCGTFPIRGIRYKCTTCPDFDFCEKCEATVDHGHVFMKIKKNGDYKGPNGVFGRPFNCFPGGRHHREPHRQGEGSNQDQIRENRCNFFKNMLNTFVNVAQQNQQQSSEQQPKKEENTKMKENKGENHSQGNKEEDIFVTLAREFKQIYNIQSDDNVIVEALKQAGGDFEGAFQILFS